MQAFIMAGGKGTRLFSLTNDEIPKPMIKIDGKPLLQRTIENLKSYGIDEIYISVSHLADKITSYFGNGKDFGVKIEYIYEEMPLGSAGALYYLKDKMIDDFVVVSGDVLFEVDLDKMIKFHKSHFALATLFTHPNLHPYDSDLVKSKDDVVIGFDYKDNQRDYFYKNNVNAGLYIFNSKVLQSLSAPKKMNMEKDFITSLISSGKVFDYKSTEYIKDIGTPERFELAKIDLKNDILSKKCLKNKQKAVFIDRDGVINKYKGFIKSADDIELIQGTVEAFRLLNQSEYLGIIVSNQPVIARGECSFEQVEEMFDKIQTLLGQSGVYVDGIYYCPHHPHKGYEGEVKELKIECDCRKPNIGMLLSAQKDFNLDLSQCFMIGDANSDIQTGINAGIPQIRVKSDLKEENVIKSTYTADDLLQAIKIILKKD